MKKEGFPSDFLWGVATASYQIEGAYNEDGKGESIWDRFAHTPGTIVDGSNGDVACDHYHRYREDVKLMKELNINSYRFSVSWPRIFPCGRGNVNRKGLDFYKSLIEELLKNNIKPMLTLYHWDLPQHLQFHGGWVNPETSEAFVEYAVTLFEEFNGLVDLWATFNEPWCISFLSHQMGKHAPGIEDYPTALKVAHNLLTAHGETVKVFKERGFSGEIGIVLNLSPVHSFTDSPEDREAANFMDCYKNRWFLDPLFKGVYPEELFQVFVDNFGDFTKGYKDISGASEKMDFLGINYYSRDVVQYDDSEILKAKPVMVEAERTDMGWEIYPEGLGEILSQVHNDYGAMPLYITENGAALKDELKNGEVHDWQRIEFLKNHFKSAYQAIQSGIDLRGYFIWTLMDDFEWECGYTKKFGLFHVNYEDNLQRTWKDSAKWLREFLENKVSLK